MSAQATQPNFTADYGCAATFEAEKALITAYEDGWDEWDGPVWPWRETNIPKAQTNGLTVSTHLAPIKAPLLRSASADSAISTTSVL